MLITFTKDMSHVLLRKPNNCCVQLKIICMQLMRTLDTDLTLKSTVVTTYTTRKNSVFVLVGQLLFLGEKKLWIYFTGYCVAISTVAYSTVIRDTF
jgi:hypothetical protein